MKDGSLIVLIFGVLFNFSSCIYVLMNFVIFVYIYFKIMFNKNIIQIYKFFFVYIVDFNIYFVVSFCYGYFLI